MSAYLRSEAAQTLFAGVLFYGSCVLLGVKYPLLLAAIAAFVVDSDNRRTYCVSSDPNHRWTERVPCRNCDLVIIVISPENLCVDGV